MNTKSSPEGASKNSSERPLLPSWAWWAISIGILVLWSAPGVVVLWSDTIDVSKSGPFGDTFAVVNALFSATAMLGVIVTLLMQRQELQLQRQELSDTRKELKRTADSQEKLETAATLQADSLLYAARLNAITARIAVLDKEIDRLESGPSYQQNSDELKNLVIQRRQLHRQLDIILEKLRRREREIRRDVAEEMIIDDEAKW